MHGFEILNEHIDLCFKYWNGEISHEEFEANRVISITEEVDNDMQRDSFY